jgi:hypothetical protein
MFDGVPLAQAAADAGVAIEAVREVLVVGA